MERNQSHDNNENKTDTTEASRERETTPAAEPRIYVASLSDYNDGRLHGIWVDPTLEVDEINDQIERMLRVSTDEGAEEFAVHDYVGFESLRLQEYDTIETIHRLAIGIEQHGDAFATYAEWVGTDQATTDGFEDCYYGTYRSMRELVEEWADSMGWMDEITKLGDKLGIAPFLRIDYALLEDVFRTEWYVAETSSGVHLFTS